MSESAKSPISSSPRQALGDAAGGGISLPAVQPADLSAKSIGTAITGSENNSADDPAATPMGDPSQVENASIVTQFKPEKKEATPPGNSALTQYTGPPASLPAQLRENMEAMGEFSLKDVDVHYNSPVPAQLKAHAFAQGNTIHVAPGQEKHLAHEAWHVVQQRQNRVQPTLQRRGTQINDNVSLEKEADTMGERALQMKSDHYASGFESLQTQDLAAVKPRASLVSQLQRYELETINSAIENRTAHNALTVQRQAVAQLEKAKFLTEEAAVPGKISKSDFLSSMRAQIEALSKQILAPVGLAQGSCPDLAYWLNYYGTKDADYIEAAMQRYAPDTAAADSPSAYMEAITERVKTGLQEHVSTGSLEVDPEKMPQGAVPPVEQAPVQLSCMRDDEGKGKKPETKDEKQKKSSLAGKWDTRPRTPQNIDERTPADKVALVAELFKNKQWFKLGREMMGGDRPETQQQYLTAGKKRLAERRAQQAQKDEKMPARDMEALEAELALTAIYQHEAEDEDQGIAVKEYIEKELDGCGAIPAALSKYVFKENINQEGDDGPAGVVPVAASCKYTPAEADSKDGAHTDASALIAVLQPNFLYVFQTDSASLGDHEFAIIKWADSFDIYESDVAKTIGNGQVIHMFPDHNKNQAGSVSGTGLSAGELTKRLDQMLTRCVTPATSRTPSSGKIKGTGKSFVPASGSGDEKSAGGKGKATTPKSSAAASS